MYLCAIECAYEFAQLGWNRALRRSATVWADGFNTQIYIETAGDAHGSFHLDTGQILSGLYDTMVDVSAQSRFCEVSTTLSLYGRRTGLLVLEKRRPSTLGGHGTNAANSSLLTASSQSNAATYPSGSIVDRDDQSFSLSYAYSGVSINSKDVFLAIIDGLTIAGQSPPSTPFKSLNAVSPSGICVISIVEVDQVKYSYVTKALRNLVRDIMVTLKKFGEVTFKLMLEGRTMAAGSIKLASHISEA